jgi:acetolactate synthase-1/3 small subunit
LIGLKSGKFESRKNLVKKYQKRSGKMQQHTISVLVRNKFGVLARVAGLFSGRGYNIESLTVNKTHCPSISKMTIVTTGDEDIIEQIDKQLNKLVDTIQVSDLTGAGFIERELALVKIKVTRENRAEVIQIVEIFGGEIVIVHKDEVGVEITGESGKIDNFIELVQDFGIIEVARSGRVAISKDPGSRDDYSEK